MKNRISVSLVFLLLFGCVGAQLSVKRGFQFGRLQNVGVLDFSTPGGKTGESVGQMTADLFSMKLLDVGFSVVERSEIERVMGELKLDQSGLTDLNAAKEVGRLAGVDAIVFRACGNLRFLKCRY